MTTRQIDSVIDMELKRLDAMKQELERKMSETRQILFKLRSKQITRRVE